MRERKECMMKRHGEAILSLNEIHEFVELMEEESNLNIHRILNDDGIVVGCSWEQFGCYITLLVPGELENEAEFFKDCDVKYEQEIAPKSKALVQKLFVPWELHLPIYIFVDYNDEGYSDESKLEIEAWVKSFVRIIAEELMNHVGGWVPANKELIFSTDTWDYDVLMQPFIDVSEINLVDFKDLIERRVLGSKHYKFYL